MNYRDYYTLTAQQIHEWTNVPIHIIQRAMKNNELSNSCFTRQTRVATPAAVEAWIAKYNPTAQAEADASAPRTHQRPMARPQPGAIKSVRLQAMARVAGCLK